MAGSESRPTASPLASSQRLLANPLLAPAIAVVGIIVGCLLFSGVRLLTGIAMPALAVTVVTMLAAVYGSTLAAGLTLVGMVACLATSRFLGHSLTDGHEFQLIETAGIGAGCVWVGSWIRVSEDLRLRHVAEKARWISVIDGFSVQQRLYLRDMLSQLTEGRLLLCGSEKELPARIPFAPGESALLLASATLANVRDRIREAGVLAGLSDSATCELIIAGSEAALNAVVHASVGTAEVRVCEKTKRVQIWITDHGKGIDDALLHRATLEPGFSSKGTLGQGFALMLNTCRRVYLCTGPSGTSVVLEASAFDRD